MTMLINPYAFGAGAAPPAFAPDDISGLEVWYDADAITGLSDTDPVTSWSDGSANGRTLTQGTANRQPAYVASAKNGKPGVDFDGSDYLATAAFALPITDAYTAFVVGYIDSAASPLGNTPYNWLSVNTNRLLTHMAYNNGSTYIDCGDAASGGRYSFTTPASVVGNWNITRITRDGANSAYVENGTTLGSTTGLTDALDTGSASLYVGSTGSSGFFDGRICELILYNRALTASEIDDVETYLAAKYAITVV